MSEAVEVSRWYFFENQECILKIYHLSIQKLLSNKILLGYFNLSPPIHKVQFNVRYPVEAKDKSTITKTVFLNLNNF